MKQNKKHRNYNRIILNLLAYFYMPVLFALFGYTIIYSAISPLLEMVEAVGSMVIVKDSPDFSDGLQSIYNPKAFQVKSDDKQYKGNMVSVETVEVPGIGTHYANIFCDRIKLNAPVLWGDTNTILKAGVGQYPGSFLPGFGKTILLSAHNTTYFFPLQQIEVGDIISLTTNYGCYEYQVSEIEVIHVSDANEMIEELLSHEKEKLILYTCYPFETLIGMKEDRLFVFADKVSGPEVK